MVTRRTVLKGGAGAAALTAPILRGYERALAQEASPVAVEGTQAGGAPIPEGCVLIASGFMSPRFLAVTDDGSIYVTEAGTGGDEELTPPAQAAPAGTPAAAEGSPVPAPPATTRGMTGQVSRIAPDGTVTVVATGLASYLRRGFEANGPAGIVVSGGNIWVAVGGPGPATGQFPPLPTENSVVAIDEGTGENALVADIGAYEIANNPHPATVDSNVYGMGAGADGILYVADAGGNAVYRVDPTTGDLTVLAVLQDLPFPGAEAAATPAATPVAVEAPGLQAVPTGVDVGADGNVLVGFLTGGPFPAGAAKVVSIAPDGTTTDVGTGLTMVTDVKVGPDGHLYAVQLSLDFLAEPPAPGNVVRVLANGTLEPVVEGLVLPNGIEFDAAGNLFIAAGTVTLPGNPPAGIVLRCDGVAPPA